jgi:hypothetical protein
MMAFVIALCRLLLSDRADAHFGIVTSQHSGLSLTRLRVSWGMRTLKELAICHPVFMQGRCGALHGAFLFPTRL